MAYKIEFSKKALRSFLKLPSLVRAAIVKKLELLSEDPYAKNNNVKKLKGEKIVID